MVLIEKLEKKLWDGLIPILGYLVMRSGFAKFNLRKIKGLKEFDEEKMRNSIRPLWVLLEKLDSLDENVVNACKKYIIINLVTIIEDSFKGILKKQIDVYNGNVKFLFRGPDILIPLSIFDSIRKDSFTKGDIIASNFNLQNPTVIDETMSKVLNLKFFETLKEICELKPDETILEYDHYAVDEGLFDWAKDRNDLADRWEFFLELFDNRNKFVHNLTDIDVDSKTLEKFITDTFSFILISSTLSIAVGAIRNESFKELEELDILFGIKPSKIKNLILGKIDSYSQTTVKK